MEACVDNLKMSRLRHKRMKPFVQERDLTSKLGAEMPASDFPSRSRSRSRSHSISPWLSLAESRYLLTIAVSSRIWKSPFGMPREVHVVHLLSSHYMTTTTFRTRPSDNAMGTKSAAPLLLSVFSHAFRNSVHKKHEDHTHLAFSGHSRRRLPSLCARGLGGMSWSMDYARLQNRLSSLAR